MKRLLYLTNCYGTTDQVAVGASARHYQHVKKLLENGYYVSVITSYVSAADRQIPEKFKGEKIVVQRENNLAIYWTYSTPNFKRNFLSRLSNFLSFNYYSFFAGIKAGKVDIIFASMPTLFTGLIGFVLSKLKGTQFVLEVRDIWSESLVGSGYDKYPFVVRLSELLEKILYYSAEHIITTSKGQKDGIVSQGIDEAKVTVVTNGVDTELIAESAHLKDGKSKITIRRDGEFVGIFAGKHAIYSGLEYVLQAASILREHREIRFIFIGDGYHKPKLIELAQEMKLENVTFLDAVPKSKIFNYLMQGDFFILPYTKQDAWRKVLPNKTFDYMACGKPIIASVLPGTLSKFIERSHSGIVIEPEDPQAIADAILQLLHNQQLHNQLGASGKQYIYENFTREATSRIFISVFDNLTKRRDFHRNIRD